MAILVQVAQAVLGPCVVLLCGQLVPLVGFVIVQRHAIAKCIHESQIGLCRGITLFGQWLDFGQCVGVIFGVVGRYTFVNPRQHCGGEGCAGQCKGQRELAVRSMRFVLRVLTSSATER